MRPTAIVIGSSAGGLQALKTIFSLFREDFSIPIIVVQHISPYSDNYITTYLNRICKVNFKEANEKEVIESGTIYFAPPNFHLLIEDNFTFSLSTEERVNFARPSIDILFETAAFVYGKNLVGIVLTGANNDGSAGLRKIKEFGGITIVQDPKTAEVDTMPSCAIKESKIDYILSLKEISKLLMKLDKE
jgi:two-component system chemotaxis response regulator CheB